jgi:hypothetical protein
MYEPDMRLGHHVPATRLTKKYFRRWWYWKGVSKSRLEQRHPVTELGVDLTRVPKVAGVPRFMLGSAIRDAAGWVRACLTRNTIDQLRREMMLCYFAGYLKAERGAEGERPVNPAPIERHVHAVKPTDAVPAPLTISR